MTVPVPQHPRGTHFRASQVDTHIRAIAEWQDHNRAAPGAMLPRCVRKNVSGTVRQCCTCFPKRRGSMAPGRKVVVGSLGHWDFLGHWTLGYLVITPSDVPEFPEEPKRSGPVTTRDRPARFDGRRTNGGGAVTCSPPISWGFSSRCPWELPRPGRRASCLPWGLPSSWRPVWPSAPR